VEKERITSLLEEIKRYFEILSQKIEELELILREGEKEPPPNLRAKLKVLWKVKKKGGIVDKNELVEYCLGDLVVYFRVTVNLYQLQVIKWLYLPKLRS